MKVFLETLKIMAVDILCLIFDIRVLVVFIFACLVMGITTGAFMLFYYIAFSVNPSEVISFSLVSAQVFLTFSAWAFVSYQAAKDKVFMDRLLKHDA